MAWTGATCAGAWSRETLLSLNAMAEMNSATSQSGFQSGAGSRRARDLCCRAFQLDHRLRDSPAMRRTVLDVTHRRRGAMAFAPSDGIPAADAMRSPRGCSSDAQGSHIRRQRQLRLRSCRRRTMGSASVSERGMTTPRFWTVSGSSRNGLRPAGAMSSAGPEWSSVHDVAGDQGLLRLPQSG